MHFESSLLGTIEFDDRSALTFVADLAGLEGCRRFQLCHDAGVEPNAPRVWWLQSLDQPDLTFSVTDPANLGVRYVLELSDEQAAALKLQRAGDAGVLVMVYKDVLAAAHPALA
ncbi:MAG: flagellar assembly protein FliW, partial [Laribacter sp.]|nr:flagellar assembly protein FliW [Laribacter sp.]